MKVIIKRKRYCDVHTYTGVTKTTIKKTGRIFKDIHVEVEFGEGATSHYQSKNHDRFWEINHEQNPGAGSYCVSEVEIYDSSTSTKIGETHEG